MPFYYRSDAPSIPTKKPGNPSQGSPLRNPGKQSIPDMTKVLKNLDDILAYTMDVYGGNRSTYWTNRNAIDAQYGYNQKRKNAGLKPLTIADPQWNPTAQDDDANEALAQWYKRHGSLPRDDQQIGFNRLLELYRAEKRMHGGDGEAPPASTDDPLAGGLSRLKGNEGGANTVAPPRHSVMDPLTIAGGMSQLAGNSKVDQPTAYEQAKALGMQTGPKKTSEMYGAKGIGEENLQSKPLGFWESLQNPYAENANPTVKTMKTINDTFMKYNPSMLAADLLIAQPMQAVKSLYLNALAAGAQAAAGKKATFTPDMTYAQYTAKVADAMGSPDYFQQAKDYFTSDQNKRQLAQALVVSPDSDLVSTVSSAQAQLINLAGEAAADPTTYFGIGEIQALGRGGRALKIGDPKYETALRANKVNGGLKLVDDPSAWQFDEAYPTLAQDAEQGYTQAGRQGVAGTLEDAVAAARKGVEGAGDAGKVITEIKYQPSSGVILKANPNKTTTVLGNFDRDMKSIIDEMGNVKSTGFGAKNGGFNVLNVPDDMYKNADQFWEEINIKWLDEAIARGDDFILATKPTNDVIWKIDPISRTKTLKGFGRELQRMLESGYIYDPQTNMMVRK